MKARKAIAAAVCFLCAAALAIGWSVASDDSTGEPLKATPNHYEAGTVPEGNKVEFTTSVQNVGKTKIEITNVMTS